MLVLSLKKLVSLKWWSPKQ